MRLDIRILDKLMRFKKNRHFGAGKRRKALFSYVLFPPILSWNSWYFRKSHNNRLMAKVFVEGLSDLGYEVFLYDYLDENVDFTLNYDLFIGHNITFSRIAGRLKGHPQKILLTTGSSPVHDNRMQAARMAALEKRRPGTPRLYRPIEEPTYPYENFQTADWVYMLGAESPVAQTWYTEFKHKFAGYHNVTTFQPRTRNAQPNNVFVYFTSTGNLRRGLDMVLDIFARHPNLKLYVCGPYERESEFCRVFSKELYRSPNISPMGMMDTTTGAFLKMIHDASFVILPSCSEAEASSALNLMALGLIPILTQECGYTNVEKYGYLIPKGELSYVENTIELAASSSIEERNSKLRQVHLKCLEHTPDAVKKEFIRFVSSITENFSAAKDNHLEPPVFTKNR